VKTRLTAWLSLLLLVSAVFGLPVTRGATQRIAVEIVCEQRERCLETIAPLPVAARNPASEWTAIDGPATLLLDHSLFQRPPPAA
jgi:hypothetical protein